MTEQEITTLLQGEAERRRREDSAHLTRLHGEVGGRRRWWVLAGTAALLLTAGIPTAAGLHDNGPQVACNQNGEKEAVLLCANMLLNKE